MRLYSYVVRYDIGFAPNPFHGWCTLATCKQDFRARVGLGDWVLGTGSKSNGRAGALVYAMEVEEILTFEDYWRDSRFRAKRPNRRGSLKQRYGDNIYHRASDGSWIQEDSRHSLEGGLPNARHVERDTRANAVLASRRFSYHGGSGPRIPAGFRNWQGYDICQDRSAYKCRFPHEMVAAFVGWIAEDVGLGYHGDPHDW
jgi:hypothetical protein